MSLFNDQLKNIYLKDVLILIIVLFLIQTIFNTLNFTFLDVSWFYILIVLFFMFRLRNSLKHAKSDIIEIFKFDNLKTILIVVILNIFLSYGFLYLADYILNLFPNIACLLEFNLSNSIAISSLVLTVVLSPLCEELIFRGVFLNRLNLVVPLKFAVLISSLLFASLHSFGSITSAFIFAVSMALLYLKSDNIFIPIFAHFLNNLISELIVIIDNNNVIFNNSIIFNAMSVLSVISFILIIVWIVKQLNIIND